MLGRAIRLALVLFALAPLTAARAAVIWAPVNSGTTQTITAISAPSTTSVVFATSGGQIFYLFSGTTFLQSVVAPTNPSGFTDVAMSPDGSRGVAVGLGGKIYKSTDAGHTWSPASIGLVHTGACPTPGPATTPSYSGDLVSVKFADATTVYVTGSNDDVLKSTTGGASFADVNKTASGCVADPGGNTAEFSDSFWLNASTGYLLSNDFGVLWSTNNGFLSATQKNGGANGFTFRDQLAVDSADITRAWAVSAGAMNGSFFQSTTDGGNNWTTPTFDDNQVALQDIAASGTTVVAVGSGGDIYTSPDGRTFFRQIAAPPNTTTNWRGVAVPNATTAWVGGEGGALVTSTTANQVPDTTPPTGVISGPAHLVTGQFGTYTVSAADNAGGSGIDASSFVWSTAGQPDQPGTTAHFAFGTAGTFTISVAFKDLAGNPGSATFPVTVGSPVIVIPPPSGSSPVSTTTGGATITIFRHVTVKGRKGRFIPVVLKTTKPRKFVISLVTIAKKHKRSKTLATLGVTIRSGKRTVHVNVPTSVKSGSYSLVVKIFTTGKHAHRVGKSVKQVFVLT